MNTGTLKYMVTSFYRWQFNVLNLKKKKKLCFEVQFAQKQLVFIISCDLKNRKGLVWLTNFGPKLLTAARLRRPGSEWNVLASVVCSKPFIRKSLVWVRPSPQQSTVAASHVCSPSGKMGWWSHVCAWQKTLALIDTLYGRSHSKKN